jgi:hypothetical protein
MARIKININLQSLEDLDITLTFSVEKIAAR